MDWTTIAVFGGIAFIGLLAMMAMQKDSGGEGGSSNVAALIARPTGQSALKSFGESMRNKGQVRAMEGRVSLAQLEAGLARILNETLTVEEERKYIAANIEMGQQERLARLKTLLETELTEQEFQRRARDLGYSGQLLREVTLLREQVNAQLALEVGKARALKGIDREDYEERLRIDQDQVTRAQLEPYEHRKEKVRMLSEYREELEDETDSARRATLKREIRRLEDELDAEGDGPVQAAPEQKKRRSLPAPKRAGGSRAEDEADEEQVSPPKSRGGGKRGAGKRGGEGESRPLTW